MAVQLLSDTPVQLVGPPVQLVGNPQTLVGPPTPGQTPFELDNDGTPLSWAGPGPVQITISPGFFNYASDAGGDTPVFSNVLTPQEFNLLVAATHVWELEANVHFNFVADSPPGVEPSDVRVALSDLNKNVPQSAMQFVGETEVHWIQNSHHFVPDTVTGIEDPAEHPVSQMSDGDLQYVNTTATMFQSMIHELGHALGLAHNNADANSIMNPVLGKTNPLPDQQDITSVQQLYGAPTQGLRLSQGELTTLQNLFSHIG